MKPDQAIVEQSPLTTGTSHLDRQTFPMSSAAVPDQR